MTTTIVILALAFAFVALRLWSVLGRRTGHEQPIAPVEGTLTPRPPVAVEASRRQVEPPASQPAAAGLRQIVAADPSFDTAAFVEGAQAAYRMILEAFWKGDAATLAKLTDDHVRADFEAAIADREARGFRLDNRLVTIEKAVIEDARVDGQVAHVTVHFEADVAAVTRDADGNVVAGSMTDAVATHDVWTFSRTVKSADPNWILTETDESA